MPDPMKKLMWGRALMKSAFAVAMMALLFYYTKDKNVTVAAFLQAVSGTSLAVVLVFEAIDHFTDKSDYTNLYWSVGARLRGGTFGAVLGALVVSAVIFFAVLVAVTGTVAFSLGQYNPATILWAGMVATYTMLPNTGDEPLLLYIWLAASIVTHNFVLLPAFAMKFVKTRMITALLG
ncbi:hypothetical protein [Thermococcus sp. 9N3]|uniref:hypothetical protein n=1 Tax=Thermococcus sp. 9N3 TaxID=163002 RepID=UPI0014317509|nr:hypothetical protein [Thermococcus sp. 9N3]NJE48410.1 hypothetical protein [Thermococcus sp. 9N3]